MDAKSLYLAGQLTEAVAAAFSHVKSKPTDVGGRLFLAELLCYQADWDRAEKQLDTVVQQSEADGYFALLFRQLIRGEILREQVFSEGRPPQLVGELPRDATLQLELCAALRGNQIKEAAELVNSAQEARQPLRGQCNGKSFDDLQDLDDRIAGIVEVITTTGKYYWVPWKSIKELEFSKPERPTDLLWRKVTIDVEGGPEGEVFIPVRYPFPNGTGWDDQLRLGRATSWAGEENGVVTGLGQRMILVGEEAICVMDIERIAIDMP